jgi:hypothetical protein
MTRQSIWLFALILGVAGAYAQEPCPGQPNAHVVSRTEKTEQDGTIRRTTSCECDAGYEKREGECKRIPVLRPPAPTIIRSETRAECVRFAGEQLRVHLNACPSPFLACLTQEGVPWEGAMCVLTTLGSAVAFADGAVVDPTKVTTVASGAVLAGALAGCNINARNISTACAPAIGACEETSLKTHRGAVAACPNK